MEQEITPCPCPAPSQRKGLGSSCAECRKAFMWPGARVRELRSGLLGKAIGLATPLPDTPGAPPGAKGTLERGMNMSIDHKPRRKPRHISWRPKTGHGPDKVNPAHDHAAGNVIQRDELPPEEAANILAAFEEPAEASRRKRPLRPICPDMVRGHTSLHRKTIRLTVIPPYGPLEQLVINWPPRHEAPGKIRTD